MTMCLRSFTCVYSRARLDGRESFRISSYTTLALARSERDVCVHTRFSRARRD